MSEWRGKERKKEKIETRELTDMLLPKTSGMESLSSQSKNSFLE